jgi:hypothetical protein
MKMLEITYSNDYRRTGTLLRWQKKRGVLRSVKDPQHGRFDLWEIAV